jgi:thiol-disulfide isomerase/thioredoxin
MDRQAAWTWTAIVALGLLCAGLGLWLGKRVFLPAEQDPPAGLAVASEGELAPLITLPRLDTGAPVALTGPGRPRLVNFWASWCGPCREEMPVLERFAAEQGTHGVQVIGVALEDPEPARAFARETGVGFLLLVQPAGPADSSVQLGNRRGVLPYSVLLDAEGRLVKTHLGVFPSVAAVEAFVRH